MTTHITKWVVMVSFKTNYNRLNQILSIIPPNERDNEFFVNLGIGKTQPDESYSIILSSVRIEFY